VSSGSSAASNTRTHAQGSTKSFSAQQDGGSSVSIGAASGASTSPAATASCSPAMSWSTPNARLAVTASGPGDALLLSLALSPAAPACVEPSSPSTGGVEIILELCPSPIEPSSERLPIAGSSAAGAEGDSGGCNGAARRAASLTASPASLDNPLLALSSKRSKAEQMPT